MRASINYRTQRLVALAQGGHEDALNELCKTYGERIRRIIRLRMGPEIRSKLESMDLVQDAFISALRSLGNFTYENEGDFLRWVSHIAENRLRDHVEKFHAAKRDIRKETPLNSNKGSGDTFVSTSEPADSTTPSVVVSRREDLAKLEEAMGQLKPEYREIIVLVKIDGLSYQEVAERLGKRPNAVRMLLSRAMAELSESFKSEP